jgi:hypothetical protein
VLLASHLHASEQLYQQKQQQKQQQQKFSFDAASDLGRVLLSFFMRYSTHDNLNKFTV